MKGEFDMNNYVEKSPSTTLDKIKVIISAAGNTITSVNEYTDSFNTVYTFNIINYNGLEDIIIFHKSKEYSLKDINLRLSIHQLDLINQLLLDN